MATTQLDDQENEGNNGKGEITKIFSDDAVKALQEFGKVLLAIRTKMIAEGKVIEVDSHYVERNSDQ